MHGSVCNRFVSTSWVVCEITLLTVNNINLINYKKFGEYYYLLIDCELQYNVAYIYFKLNWHVICNSNDVSKW